MPHLHPGRLEMTFMRRRFFETARAGIYSAVAAVEADAIHAPLVDHGLVVDVNIRDRHIVHRAVVEERPVAPVSTLISMPEISKPVIHAAIKANMWPPVSRMPKIEASAPAPITRGPKQAGLRSHYPGSRHPVVSIRAIRPITRRPDIAVAGTSRLHVHRQHRRRDPHLD